MNKTPARLLLAVLAFVAMLPLPHDAYGAARQTVAVTLQDPSADASLSGMQIKTDVSLVKAGRVSFEAANRSKTLVHEMLVIPAPPDGKELPYDAKKEEVPERRVHSLGEISELKPGARGRLTLTLKPGTYLLLCNQPGHYTAGMVTRLVVEK